MRKITHHPHTNEHNIYLGKPKNKEKLDMK
jgi:hypothetical protein